MVINQLSVGCFWHNIDTVNCSWTNLSRPLKCDCDNVSQEAIHHSDTEQRPILCKASDH